MSGHHPMSGCLLTYTFALLLTSTSVLAAVQKLNSIKDLKKIDFGDSVPTHSLLLLHWFVNMLEMDNNHAFDPNRRDYGTHEYANFEQMLDPLPRGYRYYTIGNLHAQSSSVRLPSYVTRPPHHLMEYEDSSNRDRIIFRVREDHSSNLLLTNPTIDQVYITQHYGDDQDTSYDPAHTYRITSNLLREIRLFSMGGNQRSSLREIRDQFGGDIGNSQLRDLENTWGDLAFVGLLLFIVIRLSPPEATQRSHQVPSPHSLVNIPEDMQNDWGFSQARQNATSENTCEWLCKCALCALVIIIIIIIYITNTK